MRALRRGRHLGVRVASYTADMSRTLLERRLAELTDELAARRRELRVAEEQLAQFAEEADDARLRSLVSETPLAEREYRDAQRHADAMSRHRSEVAESIARIERTQDELLDKLIEESKRS